MADKDRVLFSREQQETVDRLIDRAWSKGMTRGTREAQAEIERLKSEIEKLKNKKGWSLFGGR